MNDQHLDNQLRQLFEADFRSVNPKGAGATALLELILREKLDVETDLPALAHPNSNSNPNIELPEFDGGLIPLVDEPSRLNRGRILVAAAILLAALIGVGRWSTPATDELPVFSEVVDVNAGGEAAPVDFIEGPANPLVLIDQSGLDPELILECTAGPAAPDENPLFEGSAVLGVVSGSAGADSPIAEGMTPTIAIAVDALHSTICEFGERPVFPLGTATLDALEPNGVTVTLISRPIGSAGVVVGSLNDNVAEVRLVDVASESQDFQRFGEGFFRLDYDSPFELILEVVFNDGSSFQSDPNLLVAFPEVHRCTNATCVAERLDDLRAEALEAGAATQAEYLASGVLSQSEYDAAERAFLGCISSDIELGSGPTILQAGSDQANIAQDCFNDEIAFLERARLQQNGVAQILAAFLGRPVLEPAAMLDEVERLFEGGLSAKELEQHWNMFPATGAEADILVEQYLTDFAWVEQRIEFESYLYEQLPGTGIVYPVVVAQSVDDAERATAFVFDEVDGEMVLRQLPALDGVSTASYDNNTNQLITGAVAPAGRIAAFYGGGELSRATGTNGSEARFDLPSDVAELSVAVVVTPTLNGPVAEAVVVK